VATGYPVGVIYDADGSVIDAVFGADASQPMNCQNNGVFVWMDNINPDATIAHAIILLNGLCATDANLLAMMSFEVERAFGRILNLDFSQVNPGAQQNGEAGGTAGMAGDAAPERPLRSHGRRMHPQPSATGLRRHRRAQPHLSHHRCKPGQFPGKQLTAASTVSIQGTVSLPHRPGHAGRQCCCPPARRQRQSPLSVHSHLSIRRILQRQPRQPDLRPE
jgi:hypothetical protein